MHLTQVKEMQPEAAAFITLKQTNFYTVPYPEAESDTAQSQSCEGSSHKLYLYPKKINILGFKKN